MKRLHLLLFFFFHLVYSFSQNNDFENIASDKKEKWLAEIRQEYQIIEEKLEKQSFAEKHFNMYCEGTTGVFDYYFDTSGIRLIKILRADDSYHEKEHFYFKNGQLIFYFQVIHHDIHPYMLEINPVGTVNDTEKRLYYKNGQLFKCLHKYVEVEGNYYEGLNELLTEKSRNTPNEEVKCKDLDASYLAKLLATAELPNKDKICIYSDY